MADYPQIRKVNLNELLESVINGLSHKCFRGLVQSMPDLSPFIAPSFKKDEETGRIIPTGTFEIYVDVPEPHGKRKNRAVLLAQRNGPRQFKLETAVSFLFREVPDLKHILILTPHGAKKEIYNEAEPEEEANLCDDQQSN